MRGDGQALPAVIRPKSNHRYSGGQSGGAAHYYKCSLCAPLPADVLQPPLIAQNHVHARQIPLNHIPTKTLHILSHDDRPLRPELRSKLRSKL